MKLQDIIVKLPDAIVHGDQSIEITSLSCDSRKVQKGTLFFALRGSSADGHSFIQFAESSGASAVMLEDATFAPANIPWVKVCSGRSAMAFAAANFYGNPTAARPLVGITGTNGKTTTSYLIESILNSAALPAALLGTISYRFGETVIEASHTTPESTELQAAFAQLVLAGAKSFVIEVSSHALEQRRVDGCHFDVGVFTNLTRDHLDYHGSMEHYRLAKERLFSELLRPDSIKKQRKAVINMDDASGSAMAKAASCPVITFAIDTVADIYPTDVSISVDGICGAIATPNGKFEFRSQLLGRFNLSNILAAVATGVALEIPLAVIKAGIEGHATVPGRVERVENNFGITCLVDYAHTGDALENVLLTLKQIATARIITVFGCGGDRDSGKRPIMGKIAAEMSDLAIATSDNPRTEDPFAILEQVKSGIAPLGLCEYKPSELTENFKKHGFTVIESRRDAIRLAVNIAKAGDIILIAGKGHEDYQIIGKTKHHFDDREEAAMAFIEKKI